MPERLPAPELEGAPIVAPKHLTVTDVAAAAGVSTSTVSRALRGSPLINEQTRERVLATMRELGYAPSAVARSLRTRSSPFVGVVVPDVELDFFASVLKGAQDVLEARGFQVLLVNSERDAGKEAAALSNLVSHRVAGILLATSGGYEPCGVPVVFFDQVPATPTLDESAILLDNAQGVDVLLTHLIAHHGHTRIGHVTGPAGQTSSDERRVAFDAVIARAGLVTPPEYVRATDRHWSEGSSEQATAAMMALDEPPTAILCDSDIVAVGALRGVRGAGRRVPDDVAMACFGEPRLGDVLDPPLTALSKCSTALGAQAADALLARLGGSQERVEVRLPAELVVRRSCGCP